MPKPLVTTTARSHLMKRVRQKGTAPELAVRSALSEVGASYRLNVRGLAGRPDVANRSRRKALFVHGCFWHWHQGCSRGRIPASNSAFWREKLLGNRARDARKLSQLESEGFDVLVVWECETTDRVALNEMLRTFWFR